MSEISSGTALITGSTGGLGRWAYLRDGDFVVVDKVRGVMPIAKDPGRERRLWDATSELLNQALSGR
jgi:hypothetical protein